MRFEMEVRLVIAKSHPEHEQIDELSCETHEAYILRTHPGAI
jgi:hypothetical protein